MNEYEAKLLLKDYGIKVPKDALINDVSEIDN